MKEFKVFAEETLLLEILSEQKDLINWNSILAHHALINLDMEEEQLDLLKSDPSSSLIGQFMHAHGHRKVVAAKKFFQDFEKDNSVACHMPFAAFFLDKDDDSIDELRKNYSMTFMNRKIDDEALTGIFGKRFGEGFVCESGDKVGWQLILEDHTFLFNTLVFTDPHLFLNEENGVNIGIPNILNFFDAILPQDMSVPMHILIVSSETNKDQQRRNSPGFTNDKAERIFNTISSAIKNMRTYDFVIEMIFTPNTVHDRYAFTNYNVFECKSGFKFFSVSDNKTIVKTNTFSLNYYFQKNKKREGDTNFQEARGHLFEAKAGINVTLNTLKAVNRNLEYQKCFGIGTDYTVQNRIMKILP